MSMVDRFTRHASLTARRAAVAVLMALLVIPFVPATVSADPIINAPNLPCVVLVGNPGWVNPPTATDDGYSRENGNLSDPTDTTHFSLNVPAPGVLGNDSGGPSGWFAALYTGPAHASQFQLNSDGSFHYVPTAGYLGGDSFTYVRYVNGGVCSTGAIVTIAPATSLRGQDDVYVAYRDTTLNVGNIAGELAICSFPGICGVLNNDLLLQPVNPLASPGTYINPVAYIPHGVGVPANGIVTETHSFPVGVAYATPHGVVDLRADGSFSYTPEAGFTGTDYFGYSSARSQDDWGVAAHVQELVNLVGTVITWDWNIVRIDVVAGPAQSVPQGVNDAVSATEDTTTTINAGTLLANDVNANFITYVQSTNSPGTFRSDHGTVAVRYSEFFPGFFNSIRVTSIDYTPDPNYNGPDRFTYNVASTYFDGHWNTTDYTGTVILNVAAAPDPPIANGDFAVTNFNQAITVDAIANDSDADGDLDQDTLKRDSYPCFHQSRVVLSCIGTDDPSGWTALAHGTWQPHADGTITYTPAAGFIGEAVYPYEICDIAGACDHESISVAVRSVADDPYQTPEDTTLTVLAAGVLANDKPGETAILGTTTQHGALTLQSTGAFTYVPAANFHGTDSFTYRISSQETATVTIEVGSVNDAPDLVLNHYCDRSNVNVVCLNGDVRDIAEGGTAELNGFIKDPEFDGGTLTITWGDGATTTVAYPCAGATCPFTSTATFSTGCIGSCGNPLFFHLTHVYADDPSGATEYFSIGGSAVEADDTTDTASTGARVLNVAPDLTISPEGCDLCLGSFTHLVKNTGELASVAGRVIDLGLETGTLTIDWGDGSAPSTVTMGCGSPTTLCVTTSQHSLSCGTGVSFGLACGFFSVPHTYLGGGTFTLQVTADDGDGGSDSGQATATITGEAIDTAPSITSANSSTFTVGSAGSFTVTTTGHPTASLAVQGALPSGITFTDNGNGTATLAGTPAAGTGGDHAVTISADNDVAPNASQSFTLHVRAAPAITSASNTTFTVGSPGSFTVTTSGVPTATLTRTGTLPSGISFIDNGDGTATLGGTPAAGSGGDYPLSFSAANGVAPNASQSFTLHVRAAPAVTSANSTTFTVGSPGSFTVTTTGVPVAAITEAGSLPAGITFTDNGNGTATLAGTPAFGTGGDYSLTLTANNGVAPNATQTFTLRVQSAPAITSASSVTFTVGSAGSFTVMTTGSPAPGAQRAGHTARRRRVQRQRRRHGRAVRHASRRRQRRLPPDVLGGERRGSEHEPVVQPSRLAADPGDHVRGARRQDLRGPGLRRERDRGLWADGLLHRVAGERLHGGRHERCDDLDRRCRHRDVLGDGPSGRQRLVARRHGRDPDLLGLPEGDLGSGDPGVRPVLGSCAEPEREGHRQRSRRLRHARRNPHRLHRQRAVHERRDGGVAGRVVRPQWLHRPIECELRDLVQRVAHGRKGVGDRGVRRPELRVHRLGLGDKGDGHAHGAAHPGRRRSPRRPHESDRPVPPVQLGQRDLGDAGHHRQRDRQRLRRRDGHRVQPGDRHVHRHPPGDAGQYVLRRSAGRCRHAHRLPAGNRHVGERRRLAHRPFVRQSARCRVADPAKGPLRVRRLVWQEDHDAEGPRLVFVPRRGRLRLRDQVDHVAGWGADPQRRARSVVRRQGERRRHRPDHGPRGPGYRRRELLVPCRYRRWEPDRKR